MRLRVLTNRLEVCCLRSSNCFTQVNYVRFNALTRKEVTIQKRPDASPDCTLESFEIIELEKFYRFAITINSSDEAYEQKNVRNDDPPKSFQLLAGPSHNRLQ